MSKARADVLERLYAVIEERKGADPDASYTARLFEKGTHKLAQKLGEEAVEAVIAAVDGGKPEFVEESADVLYHLLVLWADRGVAPADVFAALEARMRVSGLEEKAARKRDDFGKRN